MIAELHSANVIMTERAYNYRRFHQNQTSVPQLRATVTQNANRNDGFRDLWRKILWAASAPGQPPIKASRCNDLSGVRHAPLRADDLSMPYATAAAKLAVR